MTLRRRRTGACHDPRQRILLRAQVCVEALLQLSERLEIRISALIRHAPTWRPLDTDFRRASCAPTSAYATTLAANRSPCRGRRVPSKTIDLTTLYRVSFNPQLTPKK